MNDDLTKVRDTVLEVVHARPLADAVKDVRIEPGYLTDGDEFLRVILQLDIPPGFEESEAIGLMRDIEKAVRLVDERFASVRFLEAA